ncbi:carbon catabolite repressor protein 4 homolog 6-like isoform X2 [Helianthus annuus]|uniref:carbon catabolite repressor protein 4 homolog 6-like isoform X2 n=1 Tax=Helianthus annuus TaxID=4232 RepID=UPI000B906AD3|nr:carbon catabolite repressor protein 4 homolog 6-like isoform X2 [Helianthus annuus]XP_035835553.1 carbon catabolite repressor protein 4 homolog 6-like isoform X2 [Helianthus annuus]
MGSKGSPCYPSTSTRGKLGFYYKDHEILPPLPRLTINTPGDLAIILGTSDTSSLYNFISEQKLNMSELPRDKISGQYSAEIYPKRLVFSNFRSKSIDNATQSPTSVDNATQSPTAVLEVKPLM